MNYKEAGAVVGTGVSPIQEYYLVLLKEKDETEQTDTEARIAKYSHEKIDFDFEQEKRGIIVFFQNLFDRLFEQFEEPKFIFCCSKSKPLFFIYGSLLNQTDYNIYHEVRMFRISKLQFETTSKKENFDDKLEECLKDFDVSVKEELSPGTYFLNQKFDELRNLLEEAFPNLELDDTLCYQLLDFIKHADNKTFFFELIKDMEFSKKIKDTDITQDEYEILFKKVYNFFRLYQLM